jgi:hypothetical protein
MTEQNPIAQKLRDLLFEIEGGKEAKFLLCVCDDRLDRRTVRRNLIRGLRRGKKTVVSISAKNAAGRLLNSFSSVRGSDTVDCIDLWGIPSMKPTAAERVYAELNFHRDALASLGLPLLVWLTSAQVQKLASTAPDFWSRRTAVYFFNKPSTKELLERLFARDKRGKGAPPSDVESALLEILGSEKKLSRCLRKSQHFSVEAADAQIKILESSLDHLIQQCKKGRQIEVALWLWNATHVERSLRFFVNGLKEPGMKDVYGYVYTDRSEVILYLAERMPEILAEYGKSVRKKVRQRKRANLVILFKDIAFDRMNEVLAEIEQHEERSVHTLPVWSYEILDDYAGVQVVGESSQETYELESWLSGYSAKRPDYFSASEARMLKALYSESSDPEAIASDVGLSVKETTRRVAELEAKVRLYLAGKRLTLPQTQTALTRHVSPRSL